MRRSITSLAIILFAAMPSLSSAHKTDPDAAYTGNVQTFDFELPAESQDACFGTMLAYGGELRLEHGTWTGGRSVFGAGDAQGCHKQPYSGSLEIQTLGGNPGFCVASSLKTAARVHQPKTPSNAATGVKADQKCDPTLPLRLYWNRPAKYVSLWVIGDTTAGYWCMTANTGDILQLKGIQTDRYAFSMVMKNPGDPAGQIKELRIEACQGSTGSPTPYMIDKVIIGY